VVSELVELSSVIAAIYDAAVDPALWRQAVASITAYVGGASAVLYWHDAATERLDEGASGRLILLIPHLQRAVSIGGLFDQHKAIESVLTSALDRVEAAVFLVGADGGISFANDPAKNMLEQATLVHARDNVLVVVANDADRILRDIFTSAANGDPSIGVRGVAVPVIDSAQDRWFAHVLPLTSGRRQEAGQANHAVAAVFIRKSAPNAPPPPLEMIAKLYGLTASEVRVLDAVLKVKGVSVKGMAETLGLSQSTVKTHLQGLFRKTGTNRQSDLVKLVAGL